MRDGYRVVDVDTHVTPSLEVLLRYADRGLLDRKDELAPYTRTMTPVPGRGHPTEPYEVLRVDPRPYKRVAGMKSGEVERTGAGSKGALEGRVENLAKGKPRDRIQHDNSHGRLLDMDIEGVDINVLIPAPWAPGSTALDPELALGLYRSYHRYQADFCSADPRRLKGLILAPGNDPQWAAKTIRELAGEDWVAAVWPLLPEGLPVDDPDLAPIFEAMDEADLPLLHHSFFYEPPYFPGYRDIWDNPVVARTAAHVWGAQRLISYVLISGMLDRYPSLRIATVETGHSWLAHWIVRLTSQVSYVKGGVRDDLKHTPLEYVQMGKVFCAIEAHEGPQLTRSTIDVLGEDVLMYSSDFPHPECMFPDHTDHVIAWRDTIGESATRKLMGENAIRYLRLLSTPWDSPAPEATVAAAQGADS
ncbi:amidohydrolase family protein [Phytohabitans sp. ZYX-F-186]|uniref:Amidohydrolase family protein n=1 Tax=Phytohabitans maris TaxID=3071409 RepID=A0ABU0ZSU6_9ACTN|nr:amidohydrolase family protein [Phytohabitans sp. ZYX-F-186]MDQ7910109.1 amidohydrolase family protein [Phytohabitans sp. ZYX-F-186]